MKKVKLIFAFIIYHLSFIISPLAEAQVCFSPATSSPFAVGTYPWSVTSADFNGDGIKDLATANSNSNNVSVLIGNGFGSFGAATNFAVGSPRSVISADFNGDGIKDLATANGGSNNVSVLLGTGAGNFGTATNFTVGTGPNSVTSADFNGDGKLDLAVANNNSANVSILLNTSTSTVTATFGAATNFAVGSYPCSVTSADFNGDGKLDLAVANSNGGNVSILIGNGLGSFGTQTTFAVGAQPFSVTNADFNGDGKADLAVANNGANNVSVLIGNGLGSFGSATNFAPGTYPNSVTSADFNGDSKADLAVANNTSVSVLIGNGAGSFGAATNFAVGMNPYQVISADFNGDGKLDLATANEGSNNVSVLLNTTPLIPISATSSTVCTGTSVILTASGVNTYTWSANAGSATTASVSINPTVTTTYMVTGTDVFGCTNTATKTITVNPLPIVTANSTANPICIGTYISLTGGGATTYTWTGGVSNGALFVPASTQTYTVTGTDGNGCKNTATKTIIVNPLPIVTANATATVVCWGTWETLTGGGATTYTWTGGVSNGVAFVPASTQTFTVTGTDGNGCVNTTTKTITVNALPTVTANATATVVCWGTSETLTGGGANTYTWTGGITNGTPFSATSTQTFTVTGTDGNGCVNTATKTITVNPLPNVTANATATVVCWGTSETLTGGGANTYTWSGGVTNGTAFSASTTTTYSVHGTDGNGCQNTAAITITVNSLPTVTANASATSVCSGTSVTLTGGGATTYTWSNSVSNGVAFVPSTTTTYTVTGTDGNGCVNTATKKITVYALPTITANANPSATICTGNSVILTGGGATTYTWDNSVTNGVAFSPTVTTTYNVTGTDGNGCVNTANKTITVNPLPTVTANATANNFCTGSGGGIILTGGGANTYIWTGGVLDGVSFTPSTTQTYTVTGTDGNGCTNKATKTITVNSPPTVYANATTTSLCRGDSVTLTGSGALTYTWTGSVTDGVAFAPTNSNTYYVTGTDIHGCTNTTPASVGVTVLPPPTVSIAATTTVVCYGTSVVLTANGNAVSWVWSTTATTATISVTPSVTTTYSLTGTASNGCTKTVTKTITVNPLPSVTAAASATLVCAGTPVTLTASGTATTYSWSTTATTTTISVSPTVTTTYTLTGTDANTCKNTATALVSILANPTPDICMVTVDSTFTNNIIYWNKTLYPNAKQFYIYRDTANNNYALIGMVSKDSLSEYTDTARHIGAVNGDPNIGTYRYKIAVKDSCGNLSAKSPYHNTVYTSPLGGGTFSYNQYGIEGQGTPIPGLSSYVLKRDNFNTNIFVTAATIGAASTTITDPQYATYQATANWEVETQWTIACTPTLRYGNNSTQSAIVKSKSNITNNRTTKVNQLAGGGAQIKVFPNPSNGFFTIQSEKGLGLVSVYNSLGEMIFQSTIQPLNNLTIDISKQPAGIYILQTQGKHIRLIKE